jgi:hypothetical protein
MNGKQLFKKHYSRLVKEGVLKSALIGIGIGFAVSFVAGFFAWMFGFGGIGFTLGLGAVGMAISIPLFYFLKYKPDEVEVARRLDRMGLQERMVTMLEYKEATSYIAVAQRENARVHLDKISDRKIKFRIPKIIPILTVISLIAGASMTTVVGLAEHEIIPDGEDVIIPEDPFENYIPITYLADEGGEIEGEADQLVAPGESTLPVVAIADDGWMFVGWDDGNENPERFEEVVIEERVYIALFEQVFEGDGDSTDDEANGQPGSPEGDSADDVPSGDANAESDQSGGGEKGDGSGSDAENDGGQGSTEEEGEGKGDGQGLGAGGKWEDSNQFLDGKTYYKDYLDMYYQVAQQIFEENGEIPPELREFFELYYDSI